LKFSLEDRIPAVLADPSQITQVLMNLVINAKEAIGDKEGEISIVTRRTRSSAINLNHAIVAPEHKRNWYVSLDIKDTGCGMTPATISRMLEPFYSTKDDSRG
jgi:signal transduction histidine kinase